MQLTIDCYGVMCSLKEESDIEEEWTEKFIRTIRLRPAIYDKRMKEHSDRREISQLWSEVCQIMVMNWMCLPPNEKTFEVKKLQERWRNLRTCFMRELAKQKAERTARKASKRRKYMYFNELLFLLPVIEDTETVNKTIPHRMNRQISKNKDKQMKRKIIFSQQQCTSARICTQKTTIPVQPLPNILQNKQSEEVDEDKLFLLSLIPSFKKMSDQQKYETKMEFLSVLRRVTQPKP